LQATEKAANNFFDELRRKYCVPKVACVISMNATHEDGTIIPLILVSWHGAIFAHGLGSASTNRKAAIGKIMRSE